ncbi:MAG: hypothetical protein JWL70_1611 [Acidimicrobiia bacterium]|nr:hypothetical protein [Acidimicrobiia bacterium]
MARDDDGSPALKQQSRDVNFKLIGIVVLLILIVVFIAQNRGRVTTTFLFFDVTTRQWVSLLVAMVVGAILGALLRVAWSGRRERH